LLACLLVSLELLATYSIY